jgi:NADPH:quinone reductase-like Zn-dependent oxidoreductase
MLSELTDGTLAEYTIAPDRNIIPIPDEMAFEAAAVLGIAWLTAYRMLFTKSGLQPEGSMLVQGSSGRVTTALIQFGHAAGMRVWCTGRMAMKRELGLSLGAERAFEAKEELPEKVEAVLILAEKLLGRIVWRR